VKWLLDNAVPNWDDVVVGGVEQTGSGSDELVAKRRRLAGVLIDDARALLAGHVTAPAEPTVALLHPHHAPRVVATPTTHDVTSVRSQRRLPAVPTGRSQ